MFLIYTTNSIGFRLYLMYAQLIIWQSILNNIFFLYSNLYLTVSKNKSS